MVVSGVCSAGFSTTVQPTASAGAIFATPITNGKFHGTICPTTPDRLAQRVGMPLARHAQVDRGAVHLGGPARVIAQALRGTEHAAELRHAERHAVVERLEQRDLVAIGLDEIRELQQQPRPLRRRHR